jgi:uncharacterized protein YndB with AHSA1/START domain
MTERIHDSVTIAAPREHVWKVLAEFEGMPRWFAPLTGTTVRGQVGKGAVRTLTFADGLVLVETVTSWTPPQGFTYTMAGLEPAQPTSTWTLREEAGKTKVDYDMAIAGPPAAAKQTAANLTPVVGFLLASLKHHVETGGKLAPPKA